MSDKYDVIIAGAGPAGCVAAYVLSNAGARVLVIEKQKIPRYKVCGGGVQHKVLKYLPYDILDKAHLAIDRISFSYKFENEFTRVTDKPLMYCYMRDDLDHYMLTKAVGKGAEFVDNTEIKTLEDDGAVKVTTNNGVFVSRFLIGADGANSAIARFCGLKTADYASVAFEAEFFTDDKTYERYHETVRIDWATIPGGYAWIFPKQDHLSVGAGALYPGARHLKKYMDEYFVRMGLKNQDIKSLRSAILPHRISERKISSGNVILAGDAAGLVDPFSGEGIYHAVKSAVIAAEYIIDSLSENVESSVPYQQRIDDDILKECIAGHEIRLLYNLIPKTSHRLLGHNERVWGAMEKIFLGEKVYTDVVTRFGGYWRPLILTSKLFSSKNKNIKFRKK